MGIIALGAGVAVLTGAGAGISYQRHLCKREFADLSFQ